MDIPRGAHVLVIDGSKMLLFRNEGGSGPDIALNVIEHRELDSAATHDQGRDRPGRSFESVGTGRSSHEQTDLHQQDEDRFAAEAADLLKREVLEGRIEAVIVVAAPRMLGELRRHWHGEVAKRVIGEIAKVMAGRPTEEIMAAIAAN